MNEEEESIGPQELEVCHETVLLCMHYLPILSTEVGHYLPNEIFEEVFEWCEGCINTQFALIQLKLVSLYGEQKWVEKNKHVLTKRAAKIGNLKLLKYAHENNCPWNEETCANAAENGHLEVLKYAHENGCPWNKNGLLTYGLNTEIRAYIETQD